MRFTSPSESGVSQKTCESGMSIGPNLCAFAEEDDEEVLMAAEADVASALEDAARTRARRGSIVRGRTARRSCAARMSTPRRCDVSRAGRGSRFLKNRRHFEMRPCSTLALLLALALLALAGFARADHPTYADRVRANRGPYPIDEADARARHARSGVGRITGLDAAPLLRRRRLAEDTATIDGAPAPIKGCARHTDEASCALPCRWCKSAAVPSACFSAKAAASLPAGVFECTSHPRGASDVAAAR